jgi:hypothetical protein
MRAAPGAVGEGVAQNGSPRYRERRIDCPLGRPIRFETHPEWSNFPTIKYHDSNDVVVTTATGFDRTLWETAREWWRPEIDGPYDIAPLVASAGACRTYPPRLLKLRSSSSVAQPDTWIALVPCSHAVAPPTVHSSTAALGAAPIAPGFAPGAPWDAKHNFGFLQIFDISDPWAIAANGVFTVTHPTLPQTQTVFRPYRTDVDPLVLSEAGGAAFRVETAEFNIADEVRTYAFVAEFTGKVEVFDITEALYVSSPSGFASPIHSWEAPLSVFDSIPNNIRAITVDRLVNNSAMVYVGVSRMGIMSVPYAPGTGFEDSQRHLVKTPGEPWGLSIREDADPSKRTLLCADGYGGNRVYSLAIVDQQASSGTQPAQ